MVEIRPGNFRDADQDTDPLAPYPDFAGSMAEEMENQLNALLDLDGLARLSTDATDREVRDRRRMFVAIARGVVFHLQQKASAIDVAVSSSVIVHPVIRVEI